MKILKWGGEDDETVVNRLSELPDSLIFEILSSLETRYVVRTISLVSKRWKDLWATIPYFYFNNVDTSSSQFINKVLQRWRGTRILSMKISSTCSNVISSDDLLRWVDFSTEKKVEDLNLEFPPWVWRSWIEVPECLHSCSSITKLSLSGDFRFPTEIKNVGWDRLETLVMIYNKVMNEEMVHQIVSCAPRLQVLDLWSVHVTCHGNLSIRSTTLKSLTLTTSFADNRSTFTLRAPNLQQLTLSIMCAIPGHLKFDVPGLRDAALKYTPERAITPNEAVMQFFLGIQHVEALALRLHDYKSLGDMKGEECLFSNVKILELIGGPIGPMNIVGLADLFPKVERLIITDWRSFHENDFGEKSYPDCSLLLQLKTVEFIWIHSTHAPLVFKLIKFLLKRAIILQNVVIRCSVPPHINTKLATLQSSFPTLNVSFCK